MPPKRKISHLSAGTAGSTPSPEDNDIAISSAVETPIKSTSKAKKPKTEKGEKVEKVKAAPKSKAVKEKEKAVEKEKNVGSGAKAVKEGNGKTVKESKEVKEEKKVLGKDGKEKVKAVTGDEAQEVLLEYLKSQNRPYSAGDVSGNLKGKVTKTLTDKLLKELSNSGKINGKGTNGDGKGSQWVYWALQDKEDILSPQELTDLEKEIEELKERSPELKRKVKELNARMNELKKEMGVKELKEGIEGMRMSVKEKGERVKGLRNPPEGVEVVTKEVVERVRREERYWRGVRGTRIKAFREVEGLVVEGMGREELWEKAGIEGDE